MKTPEEIKKGLETCIGECTGNKPHCPYHECGNGCMDTMNKNSLAYIMQLESNDSQVKKALSDNGFASLEAFLRAYNQVKAERDAALYDMQNFQGATCAYCKNLYRPDGAEHNACREFGNFSDVFGDEELNPLICGSFEWRGVCDENKGDEGHGCKTGR